MKFLVPAVLLCAALLGCASGPSATVEAPTPDRAQAAPNAPKYPTLSKRDGQQGLVQLRAFVEVSGEVSRVELLRSSGYPALDASATDYVQRMKFKPGRMSQVATGMWSAPIPIQFRLE